MRPFTFRPCKFAPSIAFQIKPFKSLYVARGDISASNVGRQLLPQAGAKRSNCLDCQGGLGC